MTNRSARLRSYATALAIPVGGLAFSYAVLVDYPMRHKIRDAQAKVAKLSDTVKQRSPAQVANLAALEQAQKTERELSKLVSTTALPSANQPPETSDSSLVRLSAALTLMDRHGVNCIGSEPHRPAGDTKQPSLPSTDSNQKRIMLEGRFADVHNAIAELQSSPIGVAIVSMNMEPAADGSASHRWILILQP